MDFANAYYYRLRAWNNAGSSDYSASTSLTPSGALAIDRQPQSLTNLAGTTALFYVLARGAAPITYQWYHEGLLLPGETSSTLKLSNVAAREAGRYTVVLANGGTPLTSDAAVLVVASSVIPPRVVGPPQVTNGVFAVGYQCSPGQTYILQSADTLGAPWENRANLVAPPSGIIWIEDNALGVPQRFYRLVAP